MATASAGNCSVEYDSRGRPRAKARGYCDVTVKPARNNVETTTDSSVRIPSHTDARRWESTGRNSQISLDSSTRFFFSCSRRGSPTPPPDSIISYPINRLCAKCVKVNTVYPDRAPSTPAVGALSHCSLACFDKSHAPRWTHSHPLPTLLHYNKVHDLRRISIP